MELQIIKDVHEFQWNFAEIKANVQEYIEQYHNLVVTEENLKYMESAQKEIAGVRRQIDGFRKEIKKRLEVPYKQFELEIKELQSLVEKAEEPLKDQILKYENARIVKMESELLDFAEKSASNLGLRPEYVGKFSLQSKWTNKSAKLSSVKKEIIQVIEDLLNRQTNDDETEKLKQQRVEMIAGLCMVHSQSIGLSTAVTPEDVAHLLIDTPLPEITNVIIQVCRDRKVVEQRAAVTVDTTDFPPITQLPPEPIQEIIEPEPVSYPPCAISAGAPPMPPIPEFIPTAMPPMPPVMPSTWDVVLKLPGITIPQATEFKAFLALRGINYEVISQNRSDR